MLPAACVQRLNAFCNEACPLSKSHGPLVALLGASAKSTAFAWRCYAPSTLDADGQYRSGTEYCTRHDALTTLLDGPVCKSTPQLVEVTALGEASAPVEDKLKTPTTLPPALLQPWPGGADEEVTVAAVDATLWHPTPEKELLEVRAWHVPCIDSLKLHNLNNRTRNVSRRKAFLSRKGLACFDASRCVRGVVDGFATADEVAQMRTLAPRPTKNNPANIEMWRWAVPKQPSVFRELVARAQAVLYEKFGIARTRFYRSNIITWHAPQCTEGRKSCPEEWPATSHPWWPASLHGDTNTDEMFMYTTIMYLSQHDVDVKGGETGIADVVTDASAKLHTPEIVRAGLRVEPSIGRLLVFSAGVENMHEMLRVTHGTRIAMQMWFACEGMDPGWARPQRVAFEAEHGWGGPDDKGRHEPAPAPIVLPKPWPWR